MEMEAYEEHQKKYPFMKRGINFKVNERIAYCLILYIFMI